MTNPKKIDITPPQYPVVGKYHARVHFYANSPGMKLFLSELPKEHIGWPMNEGICVSKEAFELWAHVEEKYEARGAELQAIEDIYPMDGHHVYSHFFWTLAVLAKQLRSSH